MVGQNGRKVSQCNFDKTVAASRLRYIEQICNQNKELSDYYADSSIEYLQKILRNFEMMATCGHTHSRYKAKFMCHNCYLSVGNKAKATKCEHKNRTHHSRGLCKGCYSSLYQKVVHESNVDVDQIRQTFYKSTRRSTATANKFNKIIDLKNNSKKIGKDNSRMNLKRKLVISISHK